MLEMAKAYSEQALEIAELKREIIALEEETEKLIKINKEIKLKDIRDWFRMYPKSESKTSISVYLKDEKEQEFAKILQDFEAKQEKEE